MRCKNCKTKLQKGTEVCPKCGAQVIAKKAPKWAVIVAIVLAVASLAIGLFLSTIVGIILAIAGIILSAVTKTKLGLWLNIGALVILIIVFIVAVVLKTASMLS